MSIFGSFCALFGLPLFFSKSNQSESRPLAGALASDLCPEIPPRTSSRNTLSNLNGVCENQRFFCNRANICTNSRFLRCYSSDLQFFASRFEVNYCYLFWSHLGAPDVSCYLRISIKRFALSSLLLLAVVFRVFSSGRAACVRWDVCQHTFLEKDLSRHSEHASIPIFVEFLVPPGPHARLVEATSVCFRHSPLK